MNFRKLNNIAGWSIFSIATIVYLITVEETASYWDCGEFIAVSYKLMVPHPPGAPFFLLVGRIFSFLSFGDVENVAYWINMVSVLSSSFTILFLFWTISMFSRKIFKNKDVNELTDGQKISILGASAVGALAYTFSDSFWFSAVEAEVYAMSSFFTAFVVWAILKWDLIEEESRANRWLILIAYMMGLSIGVHLLNLVTIPALGLIYYFKKYQKPTKWGIIATFIISGAIIILINNIIIPGLPTIAGTFEITFVNQFGLPFGSGAIFFAALIIGALVWGILYSIKKQREILNTALLGLAFVLVGYSSYALVVIRSNANPPIDENNPEDVMSVVRYLKREQYGSRPLLHGQYFTAQPTGTEQGAAKYVKGKDKYIIGDYDLSYKYDKADKTILPRMYSSDPNHVRKYREVTGLRQGEKPSFADNIYFMVSHQMNWMYWRYFLWNFAGREGDWQNASWMGPLEAFESVPEEIAKNPGRNQFFMIPLFLGILGLFFQFAKDKRNFSVVIMLFFLTGLALILYLNSPPIEPRERDYIYAGSYYAFAIWIGFAVLAIFDALSKKLSGRSAAIAATLIGLSAPAIMAQQGWDDHDRSNRYFSVDSAKNFLASIAPKGILYTGGDNDTFPVWYAQDVEGYRTDVRVLVFSYYNTDWYIEQSMRQMYDSPPVPYTLSLDNYRQGGPNDYLPYQDLGVSTLSVEQYLDLLANNDERLRLYPQANVVPSRTFALKVDKNHVRSLGIIPEGMDSLLVDRMVFSLKQGKNALEKKDLAFLDVLASSNWERPVYLNATSMKQLNLNLNKYAINEGNAYRILPIENPNPDVVRSDANIFVNTELMYKNLVDEFYYRELDNPDVYYSEDYRNFVLNHRSSFNALAEALINEGKKDKAREALLFSLEKMPDEAIFFDYTITQTADLLYQLGEDDRAKEIAQLLGDRAIEMTDYLLSGNQVGLELQKRLLTLGELQRILYENGEDELAKKYEDAYRRFVNDMQMNRSQF